MKPKICIVSHNAYGAMTGGNSGHIGGVERQTTMLARWLAAKGYPVSLITWDEGRANPEMIDGVQIIKICSAEGGLPGLRFFHPRITSLISALKTADAEVYYHNCAEHYTGLIAWWTLRNRRSFVFSAASDFDCDINLPLPSLHTPLHKSLYRFGIRNAHRIVQSEHQKRLFEKGWGLSSTVLPMPGVDAAPEFRTAIFSESPRIVWVGRLDEGKRLEWLLEMAEKLPSVRFEIAAAGTIESAYAKNLFQRASALRNVNWLGNVSRDRMARVYQNATALCCTSIHEGFPNTFLEAWSQGIPLITSFDPDGVVEKCRLGFAIKNVGEGIAAIENLSKSQEKWNEMSQNSRQFYQQRHSTDEAMPRFEKVFLSLLAKHVDAPRPIHTNAVIDFDRG